jgi:hypothetical protein
MENGKYQIVKGIEVPKFAPGRKLKYPFDKMEVGDSFEVEDMPSRQKVRVATLAYAKKHKVKFTVRQWQDKWRCWRIE